jgi:hypothetical protein
MEHELRCEQPRRSTAGLLLIWACLAVALLYARPAASYDLPNDGVAVEAVAD